MRWCNCGNTCNSCLTRQAHITKTSTRHGHCTAGKMSSEYRSWEKAKARCTDPANVNYARYGGRGIKMCEQWTTSFQKFMEDMGPKPTPYFTIERVDNDGDYEPGNCKWISASEQARNRRSSRMLEHDGARMCVAAWAERIGITQWCLNSRLRRGWPIERALGAKVKP